MLVRTLQVLVHAEHDTLWNLLLDRLLHPERYTPGISETRIVEKNDDVMLRESKLHGSLVRERITVKPYDSEIDHELLEHPQFTGKIVLTATATGLEGTSGFCTRNQAPAVLAPASLSTDKNTAAFVNGIVLDDVIVPINDPERTFGADLSRNWRSPLVVTRKEVSAIARCEIRALIAGVSS